MGQRNWIDFEKEDVQPDEQSALESWKVGVGMALLQVRQRIISIGPGYFDRGLL